MGRGLAVEADLAAADRAVTPWLLVAAHRPFYCSNTYECEGGTGGNPNLYRAAYVPLFETYNVSIVLQAHVHCTERMWQVASNGSNVIRNYDGMRTPFYLLSGAAGCIEGSTPWIDPPPAWSAWRACEDVAFGFSVLRFTNATHVRVSFVNGHLQHGNSMPSTSTFQHACSRRPHDNYGPAGGWVVGWCKMGSSGGEGRGEGGGGALARRAV